MVGVIFDSPVHKIREYEEEMEVLPFTLSRILIAGGDESVFARMEKGLAGLNDLANFVEEEFNKLGGFKSFDRNRFLQIFNVNIRPEWLRAVQIIKENGYLVGSITNNFEHPDGGTDGIFKEMFRFFDVVIESYKVGMRKPNPKIYKMVLEKLNVKAEDCIYIDDLGVNLKPPKKMGFTTIKVEKNHINALKELEQLLNLRLLEKSKL